MLCAAALLSINRHATILPFFVLLFIHHVVKYIWTFVLYRITGWIAESIFFYSSFRYCQYGFDAVLFAMFSFYSCKNMYAIVSLVVLHVFLSDQNHVYFVDHLLCLLIGYLCMFLILLTHFRRIYIANLYNITKSLSKAN